MWIKNVFKLFILTLIIFLTGFTRAQQSVTITDVISEIRLDSIKNHVESMQNFGSRFLLYSNRFQIADWLENKFRNMGIQNVTQDSVEVHSYNRLNYFKYDFDTVTTQVNVIATIEGSERPEDVYIICGHYDSFNTEIAYSKLKWNTAPGADDNASGTAAVLEAARAIITSGYQPKYTIKFIAFAAEELGYFGEMGSQKYAEEAFANGENIKLIINNDMIGYSPNYPIDKKIFLHYSNLDFGSEVANLLSVCRDYSNLDFISSEFYSSDLIHFAPKGYKGVYFEEHEFVNNIHYHKTSDISSNISLPFCTEAIKASTALLLSAPENITGVEFNERPESYSLKQNYPNPFNPATAIEIFTPQAGNVKLCVFNALGQEVETIANDYRDKGWHRFTFNAENLSAGVYFYTLSVNGWQQTKKMVLLK